MLNRIRNLGLSWKVQLAPSFLILVLVGLGAYALQTLRLNQASVDALMAGPVRQSELAADLNTTVWIAHAKLYRLAATAANEKDEKKVQAVAKDASTAAAKISDVLRAVESNQGAIKQEAFEKLKTAVAGYLKQSRNAIEMADGDAGSALMFIKGAERNFFDIEKLTDDLITASSESKDREIARAGIKLDQQQMMLTLILLGVALAGTVVSFTIGRNISRPVTAMTKAMRELAVGNFDVQLPGLERSDEVGQMARAVEEFKVQAIAKAERETSEREEKTRELAAARRVELHSLADSFETAVGNIIENVSSASTEAAGAGDAGRGFAVVAQEVKALASQTAKATDEISRQIAGMQAATRESVVAIKEISGTIGRVSEIAATIAAAIEEQGAAPQEIARSIQLAAIGTTQVATSIADGNRGAGDTGSASSQVLSSAQLLSNENKRLKAEVIKFLATVRAA